MSCSSGCRVSFSLLSVALAVASNCHAPCDRNWQGGGGVEGLLFQGFLLSFCLPSPILLLLLLVPFLSFCVRLRSQQFSRRSADDVTGRLTLRLVQEVTIASERRTGEGRREGDAFMILNLGTRKVSEKRRLG